MAKTSGLAWFYTIVGMDADGWTTDTDVSPNSHRSVRSYKTWQAAKQAITRGKQIPGIEYKILETIVWSDGQVTSHWLEDLMAKEAPFDRDGNMVSYPAPNGYPAWRTEMREVEPFPAEMKVIGMETGRSAKRLVLQDSSTGKTYPLFVADIVKLLEGATLSGTWEACKRGQNYGIRRAGNNWASHMRSLLGKQVRVTIDREKPVVVTGQLVSFDEGGEVALRGEDGFIRWSWPNLEAEAI